MGGVRQNDERSWLAPLLVSRAIIFGIFLLASISTFVPGEPNALRFQRPSAEMFYGGDAQHYLNIAQAGYAGTSTAFFPLYPLLLRIHPTIGWGILISNICFAAALALLWRLAKTYELNGTNAVWLLALFPGSHFFSVVMPESLFLMLAVGSLLAARTGRWWTAGVLAALASATRVQGIFLWPMLAVESGKARPALLLPPLGIMAFMVYLWSATGDPLAFVRGHADFGHNNEWPLLDWIRQPNIFHAWAFYPLYFGATLLWVWAAIWLLTKRMWSLATFTTLSLAVSLAGFPFAPNRHVLLAFPVFFVLGQELPNEAWRHVATAGMTVMAVLYASGFGMALN